MKKRLLISSLLVTNLLAYTYSVNSGWNLLGTSETIENLSPLFEKGDTVWVYQDSKWNQLGSGSSIKDGFGFWFKSRTSTTIDLSQSSTPEPTVAPSTIPTITPTTAPTSSVASLSYRVVDTNQVSCFDTNGVSIGCSGTSQDGEYSNNPQSYTDNGDGTVTDNVTSLVWQKSSDRDGNGVINVSDKLSQSDALTYCSNLSLAGYDDWRLPDIKTMYSLIDFSGSDVSGYEGSSTDGLDPFLNTTYFEFGYGDTSANERIIDAQWATSSIYVSTTMNGDRTMFGVNLADGRIKGYPTQMQNSDKLFYVQCVRGNEEYGKNSFVDNQDETISDGATGLTWQKNDSKSTLSWDKAISYCEASTTAGYSDWRLPNVKELQSIVDYTRSPDTTDSPAIDPIFNSSNFTNENGESDYGFYWSNTTHKTYTGNGASACYVSFGRALGYMNGSWLDVHGAGAQRSDPKSSVSGMMGYDSVSTSSGATATIHGPQGDVVRFNNYVRCVR